VNTHTECRAVAYAHHRYRDFWPQNIYDKTYKHNAGIMSQAIVQWSRPAGITQTTTKGDDYNYHKAKLQLSPREMHRQIITPLLTLHCH